MSAAELGSTHTLMWKLTTLHQTPYNSCWMGLWGVEKPLPIHSISTGKVGAGTIQILEYFDKTVTK